MELMERLEYKRCNLVRGFGCSWCNKKMVAWLFRSSATSKLPLFCDKFWVKLPLFCDIFLVKLPLFCDKTSRLNKPYLLMNLPYYLGTKLPEYAEYFVSNYVI